MVVRVHHMRDWLIRDSAHRCRDVPADLVRASGVDKNHAFVAHDDRRIDHVTLVQLVRVLDGSEKNVDPVADLDCPGIRKRLRMRCCAEGEEGDQSAKPSHEAVDFSSHRHRSSSLQELGSSTQGSFFELVPEIVGTPKLSSGKQPAAMPIK